MTAAIAKRLEEVRRRIQRAAEACQRSDFDIRLVASAKTCPAEAIRKRRRRVRPTSARTTSRKRATSTNFCGICR